MVINESLFASNVVNMCRRSGFYSGNQCGFYSGNQCGLYSGNQWEFYSGNQCDVDFIPATSFHVSLVLMASGKGVVKFNKLHH